MQTTNYLNGNKQRFTDELCELLRIPSVSADPAYKNDVRRAAEWVRDALQTAGCDHVEISETAGHPMVFATKHVSDTAPTILVYGHYDVQPPDPIELWTSPPFEPVVRTTPTHPEGAIFARGACDDKGQIYMHIKAFEAMVQTNTLTCNVKFMFEGEEEVGSVHLGQWLKDHKNRLAADVILVSDTGIIANDCPSIEVGLRGLSYVEVEVTGPKRDLHSGLYGGAVANPINILAKMIASLHDENNHITIKNFYDDVVDLTAAEREALNKVPFSIDTYKADLDLGDVWGEATYTTIERTSIRPTLDCNGIWGGYIGKGAKTVLPAKAFAKISMRLVPNQDPDRVTQLFTDHFLSIAPANVKVVVTPHHGGQPVLTPTDSIEYRAAEKALTTTFGKTPIPTRGGGSIPIIALFEQILGLKSVLMGFGLDSDAIHSPDEHYGLFNFYKGIETIPYFYQYYAEMKK